MNLQIRFILVLIFFSFSPCLQAQEFPSGFIGHWEGELLWYKTGKNEPQKVKMQLVVKPSDSANIFTWKLIYGDKNEDSRPYVLKPVDSSKTHWIIDERNGILLDHYWIGNCFSGAFTVQNSTIINNFRIEGDNMLVEFYAISAKPVSTTGGSSGELPEVKSYAVKTFQKAVLRKKKA